MDDIVVIFLIMRLLKFAWEGMWELNRWTIREDGLSESESVTHVYMHAYYHSAFTGLCFICLCNCLSLLSISSIAKPSLASGHSCITCTDAISVLFFISFPFSTSAHPDSLASTPLQLIPKV